MSRLADYFIILGYDHEKDRTGQQCGRIIQRFPERDWDKCPFTPGLEMFGQPSGWQLASQRQQPTFFVSVLTDTDGDRHYCACLTFYEDFEMPTSGDDLDDIEDSLPSQIKTTKMYAPKSLILVSRLDYFDVFRNCLGLIYTVNIENSNAEMETLIGNILGCIQVPPPGGPQVRFSIGAGDRQALQPPLCSSLPITTTAVAMLFKHLGISNSISVFCAALTDHKVLFISQSFTRLTEASHALTALMYPLKYSYVYVPILPSRLIEVLCTPTPFIAGVHSSLRYDVTDLLDVIVADLDGGSIKIPENVHLSYMPSLLHNRMQDSLNLILHPELCSADFAFPPQSARSSHLENVDKEIRAVFLRFFAELFFGYRSCLTIVRIHPEPVIRFHKANFLGQRGLVDDDFTKRMLDSMSFNTFVAERGPPYRVCDIFDEVFASMQETLKTEESNPSRLIHNMKDLAHQLYTNENPNPQPYVQKIPRPTEGAYTRVHQPVFPILDEKKVQDIIEEGIAKHNSAAKLGYVRPQQPRIVPNGPHVVSNHDRCSLISTNARRLEVLRSCITYIFENKISDARKIFSAVLKALKNKIARLALVEELNYYVQNNRAMLEHQQFDLVVRLLNCALQNESVMDENGIAASLLPLVTAFCRKLCTGVLQFAYTCLQEHAVWSSQQFWEMAYYTDVEQQIRQLYLPQYEEHLMPERHRQSPPDSPPLSNSWSHSSMQGGTPEQKRRSMMQTTPSYRARQISPLEIAAEQMRIWPSLSPSHQAELISGEESTVYSQAIHYANRMVYLRVPLDASKHMHEPGAVLEGESTSSNVTNSMAESDSYDAESAFEEQEVVDVGATVNKFVTRFVDKVCCECGVTTDHLKALHQMVPGVVAMHIETLEGVHQESKRLPPIQKPKILTPSFLPGEEVVMDGLRVYLIPDGREEGTGGNMGGPALLPAEGGIFLTTYRLMFKGTPCDPLASDFTICRSFPVSTLVREKKINVQYLAHVDQWLQEGLQLRSNTFQLMRLAFDVEVESELMEELRKLLGKLRYPANVGQTFAFTSQPFTMPLQFVKAKEKNASLKGFAKRTLMKTAKKAGIKTKDSQRKPKLMLATPPQVRRGLPGMMDPPSAAHHPPHHHHRERPVSLAYDEELSVIDEQEISQAIHNDARSVDRLSERAYCRDYSRLGLGSLSAHQSKYRTEPYRLSLVNSNYSVCKSYPAVLCVPGNISDDSIRKFARSHRQYRFPVVTWRHPSTKAVLLRASGFHSKGVVEMLKGKQNAAAGAYGDYEDFVWALVKPKSGSHSDSISTGSSGSTSLEQEKYFSAVVAATPAALNRMSSLKQRLSTASMPGYHSPLGAKQNGTIDMGDLADGAQGLQRASVYVLGEKTQVKGIKLDSFPKCDFIPVDLVEVRHIKSSLKKLMRACVPSSGTADQGFLKGVEESEWLNQIQMMMQIAGATVDLLDSQGSSVMVCLEDGWDFTTQVVSVAQVLLDPYYRTFEGFRTLVEKEWLSFGHRFTHRSNQTAANQASGFAPVFLQFLDVVHQIQLQFPLSFEFNQYYLRFLAYHYVSCRFRTFMLDSEFERMEAGWLLEEGSLRRDAGGLAPAAGGMGVGLGVSSDGDNTLGSPNKLPTNGLALWDYIDFYNRQSPIFYNFHFSPSDQEIVLRPYSNLSNLVIWSYLLEEDLACGPSYDLESFQREAQLQEEQESSIEGTTAASARRVLNSCYDNVQHMLPDACSYLLSEIQHLEQELGLPGEQWAVSWEKLDAPSREHLQRQMSLNTQLVRSHGRHLHKRSTIELLVKGKMLGEAAKMFSQQHHFEKFNYTTPASCDYCSHVLWGLLKTGMRCTDCGYNCHEKCMPHAPKNCTRLQPMAESRSSMTSVSKASIAETVSQAGETRTHEGYLYKRGALLKGWKQRWFVLDSMKHQLRYYDNHEDTSCKGFIDLADVESVQAIRNVQGAPKRADDNSFFEMKTIKRIYHFLGPEAKAAEEWVETIQNAIQ